MLVDISGIDKIELLRSLWNNSVMNGFCLINGYRYPSFDVEKAKEAIINGYIDKFNDRLIGTSLNEDYADSKRYDYYNGDGIFEEIVQRLRLKINKTDIKIDIKTDIKTDNT